MVLSKYLNRNVKRVALLLPFLLILLAQTPVTAAPPEILVPYGSTWTFYDEAAVAEPPVDGAGRQWFELLYDMGSWTDSGPAQLGYGDGDEATTVDFGGDPNNKHITTYFRHTFTLVDPAEHSRLWLNLIRDDGVIVYLNGVELFRDNLPAGPITHATTALEVVGSLEEDFPFGREIEPADLLIAGTNVLAVEIHQHAPDSSDISFDLQLRSLLPLASTTAPKNVILMVGDGMGPEHIRAGGMFVNGAPGTLTMESAPFSTVISTFSADDDVTDSAASATAMATGTKVNNGVISVEIPGNSSELETTLEFFAAHCKSTGLVTTTYLTHATPAAFGAHISSRSQTSDIASDYLGQTRPNVLMGGGGHGLSQSATNSAGYTVVTNRVELEALNTALEFNVAGLFGSGHLPYEHDYATGTDSGYDTLPHLTEMIPPALEILSADPDGFFLLIEGGRIDHAGHDNHIERNVAETAEFDRAVSQVLSWGASNPDTLLLITADHETGGMAITSNNGAGTAPTVTWSTGGHTSTPVPVYGWGVNANLLSAVVDNSDIDALMRAGFPAVPPPVCGLPTAVGLGSVGVDTGRFPHPMWLLILFAAITCLSYSLWPRHKNA